MAEHYVRVTGICLRTETRRGTKKHDDGSSTDWEMRSARILVGGEDICEVGFNDQTSSLMPGRGEGVDLLCRVRVSKGFLNIDAQSAWTDQHTEAATV